MLWNTGRPDLRGIWITDNELLGIYITLFYIQTEKVFSEKGGKGIAVVKISHI